MLLHEEHLIRKISASDLKRYLLLLGWRMEPTKRADLIKFKSPNLINDNEYYEILIPLNKEIRDFYRMIELAVDNISIYYNKSFDEIISRILYFGDEFQIGIESTETLKGVIPIPRGILLYESWRDLIAYGICASLSPLVKRFSRRNAEATEYTERSLIGRNSIGSYITTIYCPLPTRRVTTIDGSIKDPLGRSAVLHIVRGLHHLNQSIHDDSSEPIIENYSTGFNYNMCNSMANLMDMISEGRLKIGILLEPYWKVPDDITETWFSLDPSHSKYLKDAKDVLEEDTSEEELLPGDQILKGYVVMLKRDPGDAARTIRLVATAKEIPDVLSVKTILDEDMYQIAIDAHKNQQEISIKGSLQKGKKFWLLKDPSNLRILDGEARAEKSLEDFI